MNVMKMIYKLFSFLKSLNILPILSALTTYVDKLKSIPNNILSSVKNKEPITMTKSNTFQLSLKYLPPNAISLIIASIIKIVEKK